MVLRWGFRTSMELQDGEQDSRLLGSSLYTVIIQSSPSSMSFLPLTFLCFPSGKLSYSTAGLTSQASFELVVNLFCICPSTRSRASTAFFFWEGPDSKYFRLFGLSSLCHTYSAVPLSHVSSPREYINERMWPFSNKTSFMDTEVGTLDNFHVSQTVFSWLVLMT